MKPAKLLAEAVLPDRSVLSLREHDGHHVIRVDGEMLMTTRATLSETTMAELAAEGPGVGKLRRVLVGGLGFGFTLKRVLELGVPQSRVVVAELLPQVVEWNRTHLRGVNGALLDDPRVEIVLEDVRSVLEREGKAAWDAILLDVDNGPTAMVDRRNKRLYTEEGLEAVLRALKPGGRAVYWSAVRDEEFLGRLQDAGFAVQTVGAKAYPEAKRASHTLYCCDRRR